MELGIYLLKSVMILSIFYVVYYIFLRKDTLFSAKRHYLLGGILASLFLPFVEFTKTIYKDAPLIESIPFTGSISTTTETAVQQSTAFSIDWWQVAMVVYAIGVLILVGKLLLQLFSLLKLIRTYPSEKRKKYTFVRVAEIVAPFSFFKYIVYNPELHSEEELEMILKHEQIHVSQWHSIDIIVANLARVLQWVNPFSWLYKRSLEENLEFIADNETIAQLPSKKQYQLTLIKASSPLPALALTTQFYQSFIKKRIIMLNKSTSKRRNLWKLSIVLPALALFLWSFNVKEVVAYKEVSKESGIPLKTKEPKKTLAVIEEASESNPTRDLDSEKTTPELVNAGEKKETQFNITKNSSFLDLQNLKQQLKVNGHEDLIFEDERNASGELIKLSFYFYKNEKEIGTLGLGLSNEATVENSIFYFNKNGGFGFWNDSKKKKVQERQVEADKRTANYRDKMKELGVSAKEFRFTITKNTTNTELDAIKAELKKDHGIDMKYKVDRNSGGEITSINISYSDNKGGNGNYSIQDDNPIEDFVFYLNDDGERGFWSEAHEERRAERMEKRMLEMEKRKEKSEKRMLERKVEVKEIRDRMLKERKVLEERREEMEVRRNEMGKRSYVKAKVLKEVRRKMKQREMELYESNKKLQKLNHRKGTYIYSNSDSVDHAVIIDKDTTDETLDKIKRKLAAKGITFKYSKVKRNSQGEITRIKITTNNESGNKSTISAMADDGKPISDILIEL